VLISPTILLLLITISILTGSLPLEAIIFFFPVAIFKTFLEVVEKLCLIEQQSWAENIIFGDQIGCDA
jgi:hypothetical protein